jgi:hypothetical protein
MGSNEKVVTFNVFFDFILSIDTHPQGNISIPGQSRLSMEQHSLATYHLIRN